MIGSNEISDKSKEKNELTEELIDDWLCELLELLWSGDMLVEEDKLCGEYGDKDLEVKGEVSGDFTFIKDGDACFLKPLIPGD